MRLIRAIYLSVRQSNVHRNAHRNVFWMVTVYAEGMMTKTQPLTLGEAAVEGLLAGSLAGVVMALYLLAASGLNGEGPAILLARFDGTGGGQPLTGALNHLAVSAVYGAAFGGLRRFIPFRRNDWRLSGVCGLAFGLALWALALGVLLPAASPLRAIAPVHFAVAHAIYGLAVGWLVGRKTAQR